MGDLFEPVVKLKQKLPKLGELGAATSEAEVKELNIAAEAEKPTRPANPKRASPKPRKV